MQAQGTTRAPITGLSRWLRWGSEDRASGSLRMGPAPKVKSRGAPAVESTSDDIHNYAAGHSNQPAIPFAGHREEAVMSLVTALEAKDPYTQRHSMNVALHVQNLARRLGASPADVESMTTAALLHDIGKIGVPDVILTKHGPMTDEEYDTIKTHVDIGVAILSHTSFLEAEVPLVQHHHEWFNGGGYPRGLAGHDVPFGARVLLVADTIDAMLSPRCYKNALSIERVIGELDRGRGRQFDPDVADAAIAYLKSGEADGIGG